jgi:hypothetical protein
VAVVGAAAGLFCAAEEEEREIALLQIGDHFPRLVPHGRIDDHEVGIRGERALLGIHAHETRKEQKQRGDREESFH